jgi:hypothetical protein
MKKVARYLRLVAQNIQTDEVYVMPIVVVASIDACLGLIKAYHIMGCTFMCFTLGKTKLLSCCLSTRRRQTSKLWAFYLSFTDCPSLETSTYICTSRK